MSDKIILHENTVAKNWPAGRKPEWADDGTRLYTGVSVNAAGRKWHEIVTAYDGYATTAYLTECGFDVRHHGPAIHRVKGNTACHRKVLREWFRDFCGKEVEFS